MACLAGLTSCVQRESFNPPHHVTAYLDWQQYKHYSRSDPERISGLRYSTHVAGSVVWDSAFVGLAVLIGCKGGGGGFGDIPLVFPPITTEITMSFCNDAGQVIDSHRVLRGSNAWIETFDDDYVHVYMDISSPLLIKRHIFIKTLEPLNVSGQFQFDVINELQRIQLHTHPKLALPIRD